MGKVIFYDTPIGFWGVPLNDLDVSYKPKLFFHVLLIVSSEKASTYPQAVLLKPPCGWHGAAISRGLHGSCSILGTAASPTWTGLLVSLGVARFQ